MMPFVSTIFHALINCMMNHFSRIVYVLFLCAFTDTTLEHFVLGLSRGLFAKSYLHMINLNYKYKHQPNHFKVYLNLRTSLTSTLFPS